MLRPFFLLVALFVAASLQYAAPRMQCPSDNVVLDALSDEPAALSFCSALLPTTVLTSKYTVTT